MSASRSTSRIVLVAGVLMVGGIAACGDDDDTSTTTTETSTTTTTTDASTTTTTEATTTTVEAVVARIQTQLDEEFTQSTPPSGVTGPSQVVCPDAKGPIEVGGVFACGLDTPTTPELGEVEEGNLTIYVLDLSGKAAWTAGSDIPGSNQQLQYSYGNAPKDMFCRDLLDPAVAAHPFQAYGTTPASGFFWSLVYWSLEGEPDRMDADGNGIPCETLYEPKVIAQVLDGGLVP